MIIYVVSYLISSSNHNCMSTISISYRLFLISYHHQTTTVLLEAAALGQLFLISYHHQTTTVVCMEANSPGCFLSHIIIKPQLSNVKLLLMRCCFLSHIIIKPQRLVLLCVVLRSCFLSHIIIKPQPISCILLTLKVFEYILSILNSAAL